METRNWKKVLEEGLKMGAYPCYAAAVGRGSEVLFHSHGGNRAVYPTPQPLTEDTLFDLASLSKLISTTVIALRLIENGQLSLDATLGDFFSDCGEKSGITVKQLLTHTSGLPSFLRLWKMGIPPERVHRAILSHPLSAAPGKQVIYSCMGYILLGRILESVCGISLDRIAKKEIFQPLGMHQTGYRPTPSANCVTTERDPESGDYIRGAVHDENARFMGGVSGNAGVFSTLEDMILFAGELSCGCPHLLRPETFTAAVTDHTPGLEQARGLGFQLYRGGNFLAGDRMSIGSYGHSGFTGTSLYVDRRSGIYCLLLTNRVHFGRETPLFFEYRKRFYNTVFSTMENYQ